MRLRLVPRTLTGRLALVVVTVLVIAQLLSLAIHMHERGELLMQASGMRAAQQIADIADLFESVGATERRRIAQVLSRPPLSVTLDRAPIPKAEVGTRAAMFETMLRRRLGDARVLATRITENGVVAQFPLGKGTQWKGQAQPDGYPTGPSMRSGHVEGSGGMRGPGMNYLATPGVVLLAQVRLRDGSVVTFESGQPAQTLHWSYRILGTLAIVLIAAMIVALVAVRWATRPLATLSSAAEELGRNVHRPPLPESGPAEVMRAARAFNTMQAKLIDYLRSRNQLLAAMSHDLKTPITRLRLRSALLDDPHLREKYDADLGDMEAMVASSLEFLRGVDASEAVRPLDMMAMLESLQADRVETGAQVTLEVLDNAIKYGGMAHVVLQDDTRQLTICVSDAGPGLPEHELEKVFEPFYRIEDSRNRDTGGTGLGLAIARQVAHAHGGDLRLANRPGGGLIATFTLPRTAAPAALQSPRQVS
jgi:signal transduction histidine kinase